jgi:plasmid stabilization system protein ParE
MSLYVLTDPARRELFEIMDYIAAHSVESANRIQQEILAACRFVGANPHAGRPRSDLTNSSFFFWVVPQRSYLLVYDPDSKPVQILRILHGARNLPQVLA